MNIPHNSLMEKIKELVRLCEQIASDYGDDASWFKQPASDEMISNWENKHNVFIPETYKEWLSFTNEAQIRNSLAHFYGPDKFVMNSGAVLSEIIRMLKPQSCLSPKMEELLMNMVKKNNC